MWRLQFSRLMPDPYSAAKVVGTYGDLRMARGQVEQVHDHHASARAILRPLGESLYSERIQGSLVAMDSH